MAESCSIMSMDELETEKLLRNALERLGVKIRKESVDFGSGGYCRLDKEPVIVYSPDLPKYKLIELFLCALRKLDTSGIYLPPAIRDRLDEVDGSPDNYRTKQGG
jgi:hypothetical protein